MDDDYKFVEFDEFCVTCKHKKIQETEAPCDECLSNPVNLNSRKPVKWEENE